MNARFCLPGRAERVLLRVMTEGEPPYDGPYDG